MTQPPRRLFLAWAGTAVLASVTRRVSAASQGLGQFGSDGPAPCATDVKPTPASARGAEYKPNAPERTTLVEPGIPGAKLVLSGTVSGVTCGPIKGARVEFWQPDASGAYDA